MSFPTLIHSNRIPSNPEYIQAQTEFIRSVNNSRPLAKKVMTMYLDRVKRCVPEVYAAYRQVALERHLPLAVVIANALIVQLDAKLQHTFSLFIAHLMPGEKKKGNVVVFNPSQKIPRSPKVVEFQREMAGLLLDCSFHPMLMGANCDPEKILREYVAHRQW